MAEGGEGITLLVLVVGLTLTLLGIQGYSTETKFDCPDGVDSTGNILSVEYTILK